MAELQNIRNFVIIAHIDHGKSTLADRFLELTGTIEKRKMQEQYLDTMELERERGITIKMQPVRMLYKLPGSPEEYELNLIDTPGHVDFSYEVSRALAAVEGAILLVDATKGVQAQTLANLRIAVEQGLHIIPAVNKIDLPHARVDEVEQEVWDVCESMNIVPEKIYRVSGKTGEGAEELLGAVVRDVPPPKGNVEAALRALVFDSLYDSYLGVVAHVRLFDGQVKARERMHALSTGEETEIKEIGIFHPEPQAREMLSAGEIGYIATGQKKIALAKIGDTITHARVTAGQAGSGQATQALPGYREPTPMVFSSIFPQEGGAFENLRESLAALRLNDAALYFEPEFSEALGRGFKCGFLGMLHIEIVLERLRREYDLEVIVTSPSVIYKVAKTNGEAVSVYTPAAFPDPSFIKEVQEPWVSLLVITPPDYLNNVLKLLQGMRGEYKETKTIGKEIIQIRYETPLADIISDFYDKLKSVSSGYASLSYEMLGDRPADVVKLDILLAEERVEAFSRIVPRKTAEKDARSLVERIKQYLPPESFAVAIQAAIGGKVIARETKSALRKDVTGYLYGGDYTRKRKLLEKQKKGKKRMQKFGRVHVDADTFLKIFRST